MSQIPWVKMQDFLFDCGSVREPRKFCERIVNRIDMLIPFDQARFYFLNDNGRVYDEYLIGVDKRWTRAYHEYYSNIMGGRYSLLARGGSTGVPNIEDCVYDWSVYHADNEFYSDYVRPQGILHSFGFGVYDNHDILKGSCMLDRVSNVRFTPEEIRIMYYIRTHLDNLHRNFYVPVPGNRDAINSTTPQSPLTAREKEIAELILQGITPANISKKLHLSRNTVNKHISNIHAKLNVTNIRELLVKLSQL